MTLPAGERPLAIDLFCGLGGWTEGLLAEGYRVVGFDIERHHYGDDRYPAQLVIQDVLTLHGSQFRSADLIVGSSPCQEFSYRAMPWKKAKALGPPELGMKLFEAQFRIQREACEAAGRHIPMVVENVRGAERWVGKARWAYGSYLLWGDVPALMPMMVGRPAFKGGDRNIARDNGGHQWNTEFKLPGFRFDGSGRSFQTASVEAQEGRKHHGDWFRDPTTPTRQGGQTRRRKLCSDCPPDGYPTDKTRCGPCPRRVGEGRKGAGAGAAWFDANLCQLPSASPRRKAASAKIAKIPLALAQWIGRVHFPTARAA